jgi:lysozyme
MPQVNEAALNLIKEFEGCRLTAYPDPGTGGEPYTIGYGHTGTVNGEPVAPGMTITQDTADDLLAHDLGYFEEGVNGMVNRDLTPNQFGALVSLAYNIGLGALSRSTVLHDVNAGDFEGAAAAFAMWSDGADGPLPGLVRRRAAEMALFKTP